MNAELKLNGYDVTPWLKEGGLKQTEIVRLSRSVVTLNGIKYQGEVIKRGIAAAFVEMRDANWTKILQAIETRPVRVEYIDDRTGRKIADFWVSGPAAAAKVVRGGITYFNGGALTLEEV